MQKKLSALKNWCIKKLGGYTANEYSRMEERVHNEGRKYQTLYTKCETFWRTAIGM